jgi:glycerol-3-phosphate dehydrogenase
MTARESWREAVWRDLESEWDVVVVGGGITGVAVLLEAARRGLKALLLEQGDFASGTSSRSSKLVHGGLRYLAQGALGLTWASVRERDRLMAELPGLVEPVGFLLASYGRDHVGPRSLGLGLTIYDWLGRGVRHRSLSSGDLSLLAPRLTLENLAGAFWYRDAQTDDARLVLRTLFEALALGAEALSRARVEELLTRDGQVTGVAVRDLESGAVSRVRASAVVNATGAWADALRGDVGGRPALRPLRGSHLLFPRWRFPVAQAVAFCHPTDGRPLFAYPWEGLTLLGTTDRDHRGALEEPAMSPEEASYLVEAARGAFPGLEVTVSDAVSSYAGVRPVVGTGAADPSKESREHVVWLERGLLTVTGGKLTTFRVVAREALAALERAQPSLRRKVTAPRRFFELAAATPARLEASQRRRLEGRYGRWAGALCNAAGPGELEPIGETSTLWAELRWAARAERVVHLEDLLLRRVRLGLALPEGGRELLPRVRVICQAELGWDDGRWEEEAAAYMARWRREHRAPQPAAARPSAPSVAGRPSSAPVHS